MEIFYEVTIKAVVGREPGMYEVGEHSYSPQEAWASLSDLECEIYANGLDFLPIDGALFNSRFQAGGVEDIRGRIYGGSPLHIYAVLETAPGDKSSVYYFGVETATVPEDYFTQSATTLENTI